MDNKILLHNIEAERGIVASVLLDPEFSKPFILELEGGTFHNSSLRIIFNAQLSLFKKEISIDFVSLKDELGDKAGGIGGTGYLGQLIEEYPTAQNISQYIKIVKEKHNLRQIIQHSTDVINKGYDGSLSMEDFLSREKTLIAKLHKSTGEKKVQSVSIRELLSMKFPPRKNILSPWLPTQGLCLLYGARGIGKTYVAAGIAVAVACGDKFLRWEAKKPSGVLYLDGEMPAVVLQERFSRILCSMDNELTAPLGIITPDLQPSGMPNLATAKGQAEIEPYLKDISLVIVDNISTLCRGGRENESESWLPIQEWALRLRSRGISVLFVHHAGKGGQQRGTSRREDVLDTIICLKHAGDYTPDQGAHFEVHFEKARGLLGEEVKPFNAKLTTSNNQQEWEMKGVEESLTQKVAELISDGIPQKEIADLLGITKGTVSKHKQKAQHLGLLEK